VRVAVNTGEALVRLGARPESGEGMATGDVVNTASRLQSAAPTNGILVGETTYRATEERIEYREHDRSTRRARRAGAGVGGRRGARALRRRPGAGDATPLVGPRARGRALVGTLARARQQRSPELGDADRRAGIGKSRLVGELFQSIDAAAS
jgi:hypothetical protein